MAYGLRPDKPVGAELRRSVRKQLTAALEELTSPGGTDETVVHEARRRIKKVRAALRLYRERLGSDFRRSNRRMRRASRRLAPIADGEALGRAFETLVVAHPREVTPEVAAAVRRHLRGVLAEVSVRSMADQAIPHVIRRLRQERQRAAAWRLDGDGFTLVESGLERTVRRSRAAMARAKAHETSGRFHAWRRRVKDHWLQLRLLGPRCADGLATDIVRLDQLDELLGQAHDLSLLAGRLVAGVPVSRLDAAALLRLVHREIWRCRRAALAVGATAYADTDAVMVACVRQRWREKGSDLEPMVLSRWGQTPVVKKPSVQDLTPLSPSSTGAHGRRAPEGSGSAA